MAQINVKPYLMRDVVLRLGGTTGDTFEKAISSAALTPSTSNVSFQGGTPEATFNFPGPVTWSLDLTYAQDMDSVNSLTRYLWENQGDEVAFHLEPKNGGAGFDGTVILAPGAIGGAIAAVATSTVSLGIQGQPKPIWPTA